MHHPAVYILGLLFIGGAMLAIGSVVISITRSISMDLHRFDGFKTADESPASTRLLEDASTANELAEPSDIPTRIAADDALSQPAMKNAAREKRSSRAKRNNGRRAKSGKRNQIKRPRSKRSSQSR
jgi:hypothetical protein